MAKYYVKSADIKAYPTAFRDIENSGDTQSYLNTEFNVTNLKFLSAIKENQTFSYEDGDYLILSLHGYLFKLLKSDVPQGRNLYAYICVQEKDVPTTGTSIYNNYILVADSGGGYSTTLDNEGLNQEYYFYALVFTDDSIDTLLSSSTPGTRYYGLKVRGDDTNIVCQPLKLSTSEIRNESDKSIDEELPINQEFNTYELNVGEGGINCSSNITSNTINTHQIEVEGPLFCSALAAGEHNGELNIVCKTINNTDNITSNTIKVNNKITVKNEYDLGKVDANIVNASVSVEAPSIKATQQFTGNLLGNVVGNVTGNLNGNATTASKLYAPVTINSTPFDGSSDIIETDKWGKARSITIKDNSGTNSFVTSGVDGGSAITLKLPATINADIVGNVTGNIIGNVTGSASKALSYTTSQISADNDTTKTYIIGKQTTSENTETKYNANVYFKGSALYCGSLNSGNNTYTLPSETGTLALKEDINNGKLTVKTIIGSDTPTSTEFEANQSENTTVDIKIPKITCDGTTLTIVVPV